MSSNQINNRSGVPILSHNTTPQLAPSILIDYNARGKVRPWARHKAESQIIAMAMQANGEHSYAMRMSRCADRLWFRRAEDGSLYLDSARFCRVRLCPMCQWRRSLKIAAQVRDCDAWAQAQRAATGRKPWRHYMLTLTIPNVAAAALGQTLDMLAKAWDKLSRRAPVKRAMRGGYIRATEITYNSESDTYHPHMHILVLCNASYFNSRDYIARDTWLNLWREATGDPSITQLDVRSIKAEEKDDTKPADVSPVVAEVCKYTTKASDYILPEIGQMVDVVATLTAACRDRRFLGMSGEYRKAQRALHLDDPETGDLTRVNADAGESEAGAQVFAYDWYVGPRLYRIAENRPF